MSPTSARWKARVFNGLTVVLALAALTGVCYVAGTHVRCAHTPATAHAASEVGSIDRIVLEPLTPAPYPGAAELVIYTHEGKRYVVQALRRQKE